jgi:hypothetical protein
VTAGHTATSNARLTKGTVLSGKISTAGGNPLPAFVTAVSAETGDAAGAISDDGSRYEIVLSAQAVKIFWTVTDVPAEFWYRNAPDFAHATSVQVGSSPLTVNLVTP